MLGTLVAAVILCSPDSRYYWNCEDFGIKPMFVTASPFFKSSEVNTGRTFQVGLSPLQFDWVINEVYKRMIRPDMDHVAGRSVDELATRIEKGVEEVIERNNLKGKPALLREWLILEGVSAWVATHMVASKEIERLPGRERAERAQPHRILGEAQPRGVCGGFNSLTTALARKLGVRTHSLGGFNRVLGNPATESENHGWTYFRLSDGTALVTDNTAARVGLSEARRINGKTKWVALLPKSPVEMEVFLAIRFATQDIADYDPARGGSPYKSTTDFSMLTISLEEWRSCQTTHLREVERRLAGEDEVRVRRLNAYNQLPP